MYGLSGRVKESLNGIVEDIFDRVALHFLGEIPKLKDKKLLVISSERNLGLPHLFVQAMGNREPNQVEQDFLGGILGSAHGYVEALKNRTRSNISERIDGLAREASLKKIKMKEQDIQTVLNDELGKAKSHLRGIAEAESTKFRNLGTMMHISRIASELDDSNPTVFFVSVKDGNTCGECKKLHLSPDGTTPRLWRFSDLKQGYHKRGEENPSAFGAHPHCRCTLAYLSKGFGFDKDGKLKYISEDYDAYSGSR